MGGGGGGKHRKRKIEIATGKKLINCDKEVFLFLKEARNEALVISEFSALKTYELKHANIHPMI